MNFGEMQSYVLDRLDVPAGDVSRLTQTKIQLRQAHLIIVARYKLKAGLAALSTIGGDPLVDLPDDFVSVEALYRAGSELYPLTRRELAGALSTTDLIQSGPVGYVFEGPDRLRIYPAPADTSDGYFTLDYLARPIAMSEPTDVPDCVPEEWHHLIPEMAIEAIAISEGDLGASQAASLRVASIRSDMDRILTNRAGPVRSMLPVAGYVFRSRAR